MQTDEELSVLPKTRPDRRVSAAAKPTTVLRTETMVFRKVNGAGVSRGLSGVFHLRYLQIDTAACIQRPRETIKRDIRNLFGNIYLDLEVAVPVQRN